MFHFFLKTVMTTLLSCLSCSKTCLSLIDFLSERANICPPAYCHVAIFNVTKSLLTPLKSLQNGMGALAGPDGWPNAACRLGFSSVGERERGRTASANCQLVSVYRLRTGQVWSTNRLSKRSKARKSPALLIVHTCT